MAYPVYLLASLGIPRDHHAIFIETSSSPTSTHTGYIYQVSGNIQEGMSFNHKPATKPEDSPDFISKTYIGTIAEHKYDCVKDVVESVAPPRKQFDGARRLFPKGKVRRCQEWTAEAVAALRKEGILRE